MAHPAVSSSRTPRAALRVRRNVRWLAAGIIAVALGGLGTWAIFSSLADTRSAIKVTTTVYRGQVIQAADLAVIAVAKNSDLPAVSGDRLNSVVGTHATVDLAAGTLLPEGSFGGPDLASGVARVGLKLDAGRIPSSPLKPGTSVLVVALPASGGSTEGLPASVVATLADAPAVSTDGSIVVDLNVPAGNAEQVARLGALKQVVIVQRSES